VALEKDPEFEKFVAEVQRDLYDDHRDHHEAESLSEGDVRAIIRDYVEFVFELWQGGHSTGRTAALVFNTWLGEVPWDEDDDLEPL
jgi:hypothetical protein